MFQIENGHPINLGLLLTRNARYRPDHLAIIFEKTRLNYLEFNKGVNRIANALLDKNISKGDKIAILLPNCFELYELYWAIAKIGAVCVPLSPLLLVEGLKSLVLDSDATMLITNSSFIPILEKIKSEIRNIAPDRYILTDSGTAASAYQSYQTLKNAASDQEPEGIRINENDPYNIIYSSGTTGSPKGIVHSHYVRIMYCTLFSALFRMTPESIIIHAGSIVFNGAFVTLMPPMLLGSTYILLSHFDAQEFIETVECERVTHVIMVPSQLIAILNAPNFAAEKLESLEMICSVGAPLHMEHKEELNRRLPGRFYELYGLTEGFLTVLDKTHYAKKPQSVGIPPPFFEMRIVGDNGQNMPVGKVGEIVGRGPMLMSGYYKRPELTAETVKDGWLYSGDLGYIDEDGFLYLVDRKKDLIKSGGVGVYPRDIEEIIVRHPAVREAAVFGIPDEKWGETPVAAVLLNEPNVISAEDLKEWINAHVSAKFQRVSKVIIMQDFPRTISGKTLKRVLRDEYADITKNK
jgi:long-chain acyl-CoA synthetase